MSSSSRAGPTCVLRGGGGLLPPCCAVAVGQSARPGANVTGSSITITAVDAELMSKARRDEREEGKVKLLTIAHVAKARLVRELLRWGTFQKGRSMRCARVIVPGKGRQPRAGCPAGSAVLLTSGRSLPRAVRCVDGPALPLFGRPPPPGGAPV